MDETTIEIFHFDEDKPNFEQFSKDNGFHYWSCVFLMKMLGYENIQDVSRSKPVQRAITACNTLSIPIHENFDFIDGDVKLTRFACYLVAMNADPKKPQVAAAQAYFAVLADRFSKLAQEDEIIDRVLTRNEITQQERSLSSVARQAGVVQYALFQNAGYRGMYNMNISRLRAIKRVPEGRSPLDFMGATESAANLLRIRLTEEKINKEKTTGQQSLEMAASKVGSEVRNLIKRTIGKTPEELPPATDIKQVHRGLKDTNKGFKQIDESRDKPKKTS